MHLYTFMEQLGSGKGITSLEEKDIQSTLNNPSSKILDYPKDMESIVVYNLFMGIPKEYAGDRIAGLNYAALKDHIKWEGLSVKKYVPILNKCFAYWAKGYYSKGI